MACSNKTDNKSGLAYPLLMWGLLALFYLYQYIARSSIPTTLTDHIMLHFGLDSAGVGALLGCYYYAYTFMQIPAGRLLDKFGTRYTSAGATFICALGLYIFIGTTNTSVGAFGQILVGVGSAFAFLALFKCINSWFCPSQATLMTSLSAGFGPIGPVCAGPAIAVLAHQMDWKTLISGFSCLGIVLAAVIFLIVRDKKAEGEETNDISLKNSLLFILKNKQVWIIALYSMMIYAPISALADLWGVAFLKATYPDISGAEASVASNMIYIGLIFGCPFFGFLANYFKSHRIALVVAAIVCVVPFGMILSCHVSYTVMSVLLFITGFGTGGSAIVFVAAAQCVPKNMCGLTTGFVNTLCMLSGVILQPLIGFIVNKSWDGTVENGLPIYKAGDYTLGLSAVMVFLVICLISSFCVKETYPKD